MSGSFAYDPKTRRAKVRIYAGRDHLGKPRQMSRTWTSPNKQQARREADEHLATMRRKLLEVKSTSGTVAGLVADWRREHDPVDSPATVYRRRSILNAIDRDLGHIRLDQLTPKHVDRWLNTLRGENVSQKAGETKLRSEATIHHYYRVLAAVLNQAAEWGDVATVATRRARKPRKVKVELVLPPNETIIDVLAAAPWPLRTIAALAARTGMRRGELCGLRWSDVDLDRGLLYVRRSVVDVPGRPLDTKAPKSRQTRTIVLDPVTIVELDRHHRLLAASLKARDDVLVDDGPVFPDPESPGGRGWLSPMTVSAKWRWHTKRCGVELRFHDLRHWHLTNLMHSNVPLRAVADRAGHADTSTTTNIYGHARDGSDEAIVAAVSAFLPELGAPSVGSPAP